jgi:penicillin-binding protein 1B
MPTAPLQVADKGLDWQWIVGSHSTESGCPGARRFPFVAGFAPSYAPCTIAEPDPYYQQEAGDEQQGGGWREWFGWGDRGDRGDPAKEQPQPEQAPPPPPSPAPEEQ